MAQIVANNQDVLSGQPTPDEIALGNKLDLANTPPPSVENAPTNIPSTTDQTSMANALIPGAATSTGLSAQIGNWLGSMPGVGAVLGNSPNNQRPTGFNQTLSNLPLTNMLGSSPKLSDAQLQQLQQQSLERSDNVSRAAQIGRADTMSTVYSALQLGAHYAGDTTDEAKYIEQKQINATNMQQLQQQQQNAAQVNSLSAADNMVTQNPGMAVGLGMAALATGGAAGAGPRQGLWRPR